MKLHQIHIRDPFALFEDGKYYLYGTRGEGCWDHCSGFDVYVSTDLEDWSDPISVFEKQADFWADRQFWAPEVHRYQGKYYMFASFKAEGRRRATHILVSDLPTGPFVPLMPEPITPKDWECLDGTLYIDRQGRPYIVFCHEWVQVADGEMVAMALTEDLRYPAGEPKVLFRASEPSWATGDGQGNYITDGPYLHRGDDGRLHMIWSTDCDGKYVVAWAASDNDEIDGNWIHGDTFLYSGDGGHGMLFRDGNGGLKMAIHAPNLSPHERPIFLDRGTVF